MRTVAERLCAYAGMPKKWSSQTGLAGLVPPPLVNVDELHPYEFYIYILSVRMVG